MRALDNEAARHVGGLHMTFAGKSVFVFGGTSGINLGIARGFARAGAIVGVASRNPEHVETASSELSRLGGRVRGYVSDVRQPDAVQTTLESFSVEFGPIGVVVSGAAGNFPALAKDISPNGFKAIMDIDLLGTFHVLRAAYPLIVKPGGCVINVSAPQAFIPMPQQAHVCAAKAGVDMLTRVLAIEWGPAGIRVNAVVPGPIAHTEGMKRLCPTAEAVAAVAASVPLQRLGTTEDVADVCLFLASDAARYISGAILPVDGGWSAVGVRSFERPVWRD